ncbi:MAG: 16S rRNA processing protein RimM [Clostridia bacterium]|nr:16S rRNA processing protein RimM [Clostridia bacterium]
MKRYLEAGRLTSQRGIVGELRFDCWCDSPDFLKNVKTFYLDENGEKPLSVKTYRPTIPSIVFENRESRETTLDLVGKTIYFDRNDVKLPEGTFFNDDLIGVDVYSADDGKLMGKLTRIDEGKMYPLYYVEGEKKYLIPGIKEFVKEISLETGIKIKFIEGLDI